MTMNADVPRRSGRPRLAIGTALLAAAALALVGCGADTTPASPGDGVETTTIKIIDAPLLDLLPVWVAIDQGFFEDEGLEASLETSSAQNAAEAVALLVSGEYQFAVSTLTAVAQAQSQGVELAVASGGTVIGGPDDEYAQVVVLKDGASSLEELVESGAKIGNQGINSAVQIYLLNALAAQGLDSSALTFENVPNMTAEPLLLNGSIDAQTLFGPALTAALGKPDFRSLGSFSSALPAQTPSAQWVTSVDFAQANPNTLEAFRRVVARGTDWVNDPANEAAVVALAAERTGLPAGVVEQMVFPGFDVTLTSDSIEKYLEMFVKFGGLDAMPDVDKLVSPGALTD